MLRRLAPSVGVAICAIAWISACRDWDRYEPVAAGGGGAGVVTGTTTGASMTTGTSMSTGGGGTGGSGVGGGTGGGQPLDCGKIDILNDDFEDPSWSWRWGYAGLESNYLRQGGELVLSLPPTEYGNQIETTAGFDFRGRTVIIELAPQIPPDVVFWFNVAGDTDNYLEIGFDGGGTIFYGYEEDGSFFTFATDALDPSEYRFWRFREQDNFVYFDLSNDGASWMERETFDITDVFDPAYTSIYLGAYKGDTGAPADLHVAAIYSGEPGTTKPCPISTIKDDFEDTQRGSLWNRGWNDSVCPFDDSSGTLRATCTPMAYSFSAYGSAPVYDLTGSSVTVEVVEPALSGSGAWFALRLNRPEIESAWVLSVSNGELVLYEVVDGNWSTVENGPHDPIDDRFLRIREEGGQVYFETSPDDVSYTEFDQRTPPFDVTELRVWLQGGADNNAESVSVAVDNLNGGS